MNGGGWGDGWLSRARRSPSPNFGPRPPGSEVDLVVIHSISLPPGVFGGSAVERFFANRLDFDEHPEYDPIRGMQVSAHFLLRRTGELVQFVSCDDRAWHAGVSEWQGWTRCNDFSIGIELEGLEETTFETGQYEALAVLLLELAGRYPIGAVVGHEHVAPGRKKDPGTGFDWQRLADSLDWPAERFEAALVSRKR